MSEDKTLKETIAEGLSGNKDTTKPEVTETEQGISTQGTEGETKSGETPEYVSGIDISDIPEQDRPRIKELLSKKAGLLEKGYQGKFQKVAALEKAQQDLEKMGLTTEEAIDVLNRHSQAKLAPKTTEEKKSALKTLDKLIEQAPYEQKSALEQMRTIILEETAVSDIRKDLDDVKKSLGVYQQSAMDSRSKQIDGELVTLSEKYGKDLIDKYSDVIKQKGLQYPNMPINKILAIEVPIEEIEQAILTKGKKPLTTEKKQAISSSGSGVTSASEKIDIKKSSYADILLHGLRK